jgi:virginiamycin B lyase
VIRLPLAAVALICAVATAQSAQVSFYQLPSGSYPHDVAPAPDGAVWFTGHSQGFLGHFDPANQKLEKISLGRGAAPHGVIVGPDGAAWVTEGGPTAIARVDPASHEVKLFPLPKDFADANLNTLTFDKAGILWFTGQSGVYGRLDPKVGKVEAWASPRGAGTYGITTTPSGQVWYASLASDHIAQIDTATHAVTVVDPPRKGVGPRRIWSDSKNMLWASFWYGGGIGRYDPMKKSWTTYLMPKSRNGTYAVYVDDKDRVWATDWPANALQRFDPATETFATFPSDKHGSEVREMQGRSGEAWGGESGNDRLVVVRD